MKRAVFDFANIGQILAQFSKQQIYQFKGLGNTDEQPAFVLGLKEMQIITNVGMFEKNAKYIGIYADDAHALRKAIEVHMEC